jgi:uncharacterized protein (TIGR02452 family)
VNRTYAANLARETLDLIAAGGYANARGERVPLAAAVAACVAGTELIRPSDWPAIHRQADAAVAALAAEGCRRVEVTPETTLAAARRLAADGATDVLALNFASAKNPGGGFLGGSRAQEESLARSSALYPSLMSQPAYYDANRVGPPAVYTDHAIYSPGVPTFRGDDGALLDAACPVSFVTMPAINVSAMRQNHCVDPDAIAATMTRRIGHVLALAAAKKRRALVLGAWGCGVFGNDPRQVARLFAAALAGPVGACFERVVFAVFDPSAGGGNLSAFRDATHAEKGVKFVHGEAPPLSAEDEAMLEPT